MYKVTKRIETNRFGLGLFLSLLVLNVVVYREALSIGFLSDDYHVLSVVRAWPHPFRAFITNIAGEVTGSSYGPIFTFLAWIGYRLFGMNAFGYHVVSLCVHVFAATGVGCIARVLTRRRAIGILAASLFSLFHTRVEVLFWLSSFPHLLATCMMLISLFAWLRYQEGGRHLWLWVSISGFAVGLFTKEVVILLPLFIGLMSLVPLRRITWRDLRTHLESLSRLHFALFRLQNVQISSPIHRIASSIFTFFARNGTKWLWKRDYKWVLRTGISVLPYAIVIGGYLLLRSAYTGDTLGGYGGRGLITNMRHLSRLFIEITANLFVAQPYRDFLGGWSVTHAFLVTIGIGGAVFISWRARTYRQALQFSLLGYVIMILIFLQLTMHPITDEGERYTYLVSTFAAIWLSTIGYMWYHRRPLWGSVVIVLFFSVQLWFIGDKVDNWRGADTLTRRIMSSITEDTFAYNPQFIIGLPDNIAGAQAFRNGFREAVWLEHGAFVDIEVIPLYSAPSDIRQSEVLLSKISDSIYELRGVGGRRGFTGFPEWQSPSGQFRLTEFELRGHAGTRIQIDFSDRQYDEERGFLFVSGGRVTSVQREDGSARIDREHVIFLRPTAK